MKIFETRPTRYNSGSTILIDLDYEKIFEARSTRYNSICKILIDLECEIVFKIADWVQLWFQDFYGKILFITRPTKNHGDSKIFMWRWSYFEKRSSRYNSGSEVLIKLDCEIIWKRDQLGVTVVLRIFWWKPFETRPIIYNSGSTILIDLDYEINLKRDQLGTTVASRSC